MITKNFKVLSLTDLEKQLGQGKIERNSIYVTFDDAYYDNFLYAKPILEKYHCPATFLCPRIL
jgi:peptidoglycan/xylan/chitin deacetylase (PgdA/CDA1 family)